MAKTEAARQTERLSHLLEVEQSKTAKADETQRQALDSLRAQLAQEHHAEIEKLQKRHDDALKAAHQEVRDATTAQGRAEGRAAQLETERDEARAAASRAEGRVAQLEAKLQSMRQEE